mgnify:CR=1 FL=1
MQRGNQRRQPAAATRFQYPQADRRGCNITTRRTIRLVHHGFSIHKRIEGGATEPGDLEALLAVVSVSTSGSKGVQRCWLPPVRRRWCSFSIHKRIEGGATPRLPTGGRHYHSFSIHKRIEGGATEAVLQVPHKIMCFSIHKRIEGGATSRIMDLTLSSFSFSIHKRIEGGATLTPPPVSSTRIGFQYPQADRRGCNHTASIRSSARL